MSKVRAGVAAVTLSIGLGGGAVSAAQAATSDEVLATRPPVLLHPLVTAPPGKLADNTIGLLAPRSRPTTGGAETNGTFGTPFAEPTIQGKATDAKCIETATPNGGAKGPIAKVCKPAAGTLVNLPNGKVLYWDALEGTENNTFSIVAEGGATFTNDSARLLTGVQDGGKPQWSEPKQYDGGANPNGNPGRPLIPGLQTTETYNDGALFGSHQSFLPDGRLLVQGGTDYSLDPGVDGIPFGAVELTGLKATRIYDPKTNEFTQTGDTAYRRWYPTLVETGEGRYIDFSGVGKLLKPVYPDSPKDSLTNVKQVEQFDPQTSKWSTFPRSADFDLPLYPRMSLLPNGHVLYNAAGQDFNPFGQSIGETNWNDLASFDPKTATWKKLGLGNTATLAPGFRGSTSSTLLPLKPGADGKYTKTSYLTAGGVLLPSPGSYFATDQSSITTIDTAGGQDKATQQKTGSLNQVRWFGQNIVLPTGEVVVFSGADKDEVVLPGTEFPVQQAELFNPDTKTWKPIATAHNPRTYHNSAVLLPSGEVLVGGHATISTGYLNNTTLPGGFAPHDGRDPSFEVFKPPYLFRGGRPTISAAPSDIAYGKDLVITMKTAAQAASLQSVVLVRNSAITHIVDADQRTVQLRVVSQRGRRVRLAAPTDGNVAPPGPYMLFANAKNAKGPVPSVAKQLFVGRR